jgi:hypothetical protein
VLDAGAWKVQHTNRQGLQHRVVAFERRRLGCGLMMPSRFLPHL